ASRPVPSASRKMTLTTQERQWRGASVYEWSHASPVGDIIFVNGRVITGELERSTATGVAIRQGKIAAVGSDAEVLAWQRNGTRVVDLAGRAITPGLNDAHCHPVWVGFAMQNV